MFKNYSKYEEEKDKDGNVIGYNVYFKGFNLKTMSQTRDETGKYGWAKILSVKSEDEAKQKCKDLLPEEDAE